MIYNLDINKLKSIKGKRVQQKQGHGSITGDETMTAGLGLGRRVMDNIKDWKRQALEGPSRNGALKGHNQRVPL